MKIGVIYCGYNTEEYIDKSLLAWIKARKNNLGGHEYVICAASIPFLKFKQERLDNTLFILQKYHKDNDIDFLLNQEIPLEETNIRFGALSVLKNLKNIDIFILVDSDEIYEEKQILDIFNFVEKNPSIIWFKLCFKNYVFNEKTYLVEPFCPPRIFRVKAGEYTAWNFWDDNNVSYFIEKNVKNGLHKDLEFSNKLVPKTIAWIKHLSWLSNFRSKAKIEYQKSRGWQCSYKWDDKLGLVFNEEYFSSKGLPMPEISTEN